MECFWETVLRSFLHYMFLRSARLRIYIYVACFLRCSNLLNATQEEEDVVTVTMTSPPFGKGAVESRLNITKNNYATLECVASANGEIVYTLFSISGEQITSQITHTHTHTPSDIDWRLLFVITKYQPQTTPTTVCLLTLWSILLRKLESTFIICRI